MIYLGSASSSTGAIDWGPSYFDADDAPDPFFRSTTERIWIPFGDFRGFRGSRPFDQNAAERSKKFWIG